MNGPGHPPIGHEDPLAGHPVFEPSILTGFHLLESDAGTGKTWTIAGLVVRALIERELDLDRILVVTFTNAATAELASRIRERIEAMAVLIDDRLHGRVSAIDELFCTAYLERLIGEGGADSAALLERALGRLRIALSRIDEAAVHTIHGFCQRVIDEHGLSIGLPGGIEVGESDHGWIDALVADWWRRNVVSASEDELALLAEVGATPERLAELVRRLHATPGARCEVDSIDWRGLAASLGTLRTRLAGVLEAEGPLLLDWIGSGGKVNGNKIRKDWATGQLTRLAGWCGASPAARQKKDKLREDAGKLSAESFRAALRGSEMPPSRIPDLCSELHALLPGCDLVAARIAMTVWEESADQRLARRSEGTSLGFEDLLLIVRDALADRDCGPGLAEALAERYPLALIDECQDTDALQWEIFRRVHLPEQQRPGPPTGLVLVGDPKQAIYAFRGADIYSYLDAREAGATTHVLRENQRSASGLIDSVNALFGTDGAFAVAGIEYSPALCGRRRRRILKGAEDDGRAPLTVLRLAPDAPERMLGKDAAGRRAVEATVAEIGRLLRAGLLLDDRPVAPADMAVLVDSHFQGSLVKQALAAAGIGAAEISRDSVVQSQEASDLMRWLAAVADPADVALIRSALLATPAGFDAAALERLAADGAAWNGWIDRFAACRDDWQRLGGQAALRRLFFESGAAGRLAALRDGERRLTNLLHLFELLAASADAARGPRQAWRWLSRQRGGRADTLGREATELRLDSDENLVRILTVHKSKGLEFPFVFMPFAWSGREPNAKPPLVHHLGPDSLSGQSERWQAVLALHDAPGEAVIAQAAAEERAEAVRRLYVALTRAEQRCYVLWGPVAGMCDAPLARLLASVARLPEPYAGLKKAEREAAFAEAVDEAVHALAAACPAGSFAVVEALSQEAGRPPAQHRKPRQGADGASEPERPEPAARAFTTAIPAPWIRTSYSAMAMRLGEPLGQYAQHGSPGEADDERPDHDQIQAPASELEAAPPAPSPDAPAPELPMRFAFPAGARAGSCLHGILEQCSLAEPVAPELVARHLARSGFGAVDAGPVAAWLDEVLEAELHAPGGERLSLRALRPEAIAREFEFHLPGFGVNDRAVLEAIATEYPLDVAAMPSNWDGFLRGFIDLVFEHEGRWYVADWKSNKLGERFDDYSGRALEAAMRAHLYSLQVCLYLLVLHRFLRLRLPDYDWDTHIGGAFWIFLRGVGAGAAGEGAEGAAGNQRGVHASRPSRALIEQLDRLFAGAGAEPGR